MSKITDYKNNWLCYIFENFIQDFSLYKISYIISPEKLGFFVTLLNASST